MTDTVSFKERLNQKGEKTLEIAKVSIFQDMETITRPSEEATIEEAEKVWPVLEASLDPKMGYGLAACQIGIHKKIGFVRYAGKTYRLLNTKITETASPMIMPAEGCLSIPGERINTTRFGSITVQDDILGKVSLDESTDGLLCMVFQHEVDHFEGITILDRKQKPFVREGAKVGRNMPCPCGSGKKYKKCCLGN